MLQTVGGDNDYVKVPTPRRRTRPVTVSGPIATSALPDPAAAMLSSPPDVNPTPELPTTLPTTSEPIVYETLRQDARVGNVQPENPYLVPMALQDPSAQPVDLTTLLANQQMNTAAGSTRAQSLGGPTLASIQQQGVVRNVCRPSVDEFSPLVPELSASPPESADMLYTNTADLESTTTSDSMQQLVPPTARSPASAAACEETSTLNILRRPSPSLSQPVNAAAPLTFRLPSYEESMSSDAASLSLSPVGSLHFPIEGEMEASPSASAALLSHECPPAYASERLLELSANSPLKSRQVQQLQDEMSAATGIRVQLSKTQCTQALALVDFFNRVW